MESSLHTSSYTRTQLGQDFVSYIQGNLSAFFVVVAPESLKAPAQDALEKSALALGWQDGPTYLWIDRAPALSSEDVFALVEGLDPICMVIVGKLAIDQVGKAYKTSLPTQACVRLFGRDVCAIEKFEELLESEQGKKRIWNLLKTLPKQPS